jgi:Tfp pilus assembly protein PilN
MRIRLSLVPGPVLRQQELASRRRALLLIPLLAIVGAAVFYVLLVNDARRAREVVRDTESRLAPLRPTVAQVSQLEAEITDLQQRRQALIGAAGRAQLQLSPLLTEISQIIPQDAWLYTLTVDAGTLTMTGGTLQLRSVGQFVGGLEQSGRLDQVKVQNLQQVQTDLRSITQFQITARLKGTGP